MSDVYWVPLITALTGFALLWPISVWRRDASVVDYAWAPGFLVQMAVALWLMDVVGNRAWLLMALVGIWSIRLTVTLARRRLREGTEDPRYTAIRESWGADFWWKSFFIVFVLQAVLQWVIAVGAIAGADAAAQHIGWMAAAGAILAAIGFALSWIADHQLDRFKSASPGGLLTTGLRSHVRHPNYTGEMIFWTGIAFIGFDAGVWLAVLSPAVVYVILIWVSGATMLDERLGATRPGWAEYRRKTPAFLPTFQRRECTRTPGAPSP